MDLKSSLEGLQSFLAAIHNIRPLGLQIFCVVAAIFSFDFFCEMEERSAPGTGACQ